MGNEGRGSIFRIKGSKYMLYLPVGEEDEGMFPFKRVKSRYARVNFKPGSDKIVVEKCETRNKRTIA